MKYIETIQTKYDKHIYNAFLDMDILWILGKTKLKIEIETINTHTKVSEELLKEFQE